MLRKSDKFLHLAFLAIFAFFIPLAYTTGLLSINSISLWGRYFCFAIAALGIDLIWGYTGIMSMCQAIFFCFGGYGIGMYLTLQTGSGPAWLPDFMSWNNLTELPFFWTGFQHFIPAIVLAILFSAAVAYIIGYFIFRSRIKGVYMAIITQALALSVYLLFIRNETNMGGTNGLTNFKSLLGFDLAAPAVKLSLYMVSLFALVGIYQICRFIVSSKFGKVLLAIRDSEARVGYTAYRVLHYKLSIFVIAAIIGTLAGILYVPQTGIITPGRMDVKSSVEMLMWVALGGRGHLKGAILGALSVNCLYSLCTTFFPEGWLFILGMLYVLTVLYFDKGFLGLLEKLTASLGIKRKKVSITPSNQQI